MICFGRRPGCIESKASVACMLKLFGVVTCSVCLHAASGTHLRPGKAMVLSHATSEYRGSIRVFSQEDFFIVLMAGLHDSSVPCLTNVQPILQVLARFYVSCVTSQANLFCIHFEFL
jgi:hypothetical protein